MQLDRYERLHYQHNNKNIKINRDQKSIKIAISRKYTQFTGLCHPVNLYPHLLPTSIHQTKQRVFYFSFLPPEFCISLQSKLNVFCPGMSGLVFHHYPFNSSISVALHRHPTNSEFSLTIKANKRLMDNQIALFEPQQLN